jgi:hypothetical protein
MLTVKIVRTMAADAKKPTLFISPPFAFLIVSAVEASGDVSINRA